MFTLTDDTVFNNTADPTTAPPILAGTAALANPAQLTTLLRDTRYSWAYVCQRPANGSTDIVNLTIAVFNKRPLALGATLALPEYVYNYNPGTPNAVTAPLSPPKGPYQPWTAANGWGAPPTPSTVVTGNNINLGYAGSSVVFDGVVRVFEVGAGRNR